MVIFSSPKPFTTETLPVQISALRSWRKYLPHAKAVLFGNDKKLKDICRSENAEFGGLLPVDNRGNEKISDVFQRAVALAGSQDLIYLNSDIFLDETIRPAVKILEEFTGPYLATARRRCIGRWDGPALDGQKLESFLGLKKNHFRWGQACSLDIFLFRGVPVKQMPPFRIGQAAWDNWLVFHARSLGIPVIDLSRVLRPFHCDHDYSYSRDNPNPRIRNQNGDKENLDLLGGEAKKLHMGHCNYEVRESKIVRREGVAFWQRESEILRIRKPIKYFWINLLRATFRPIARILEKYTAQHEDWNITPPKPGAHL